MNHSRAGVHTKNYPEDKKRILDPEKGNTKNYPKDTKKKNPAPRKGGLLYNRRKRVMIRVN
jgi:hypothetical protein